MIPSDNGKNNTYTVETWKYKKPNNNNNEKKIK